MGLRSSDEPYVPENVEIADLRARVHAAEEEAVRLRAMLERLYIATAQVLYPEGGHAAPRSTSALPAAVVEYGQKVAERLDKEKP